MKKLLPFLLVFVFWSSFVNAKDDRKVSVTIYNDNLAVVKDIRTLNLQKGSFELRYQNVAAKIDPSSVHFKSLTAPEKVIIAEQNYDFDLASSEKILSKYLDKKITIRTKQDSLFSGVLVSSSHPSIVLRKSNGAIKMIDRGNIATIDFPSLPEGLLTKPTLVWRIICEKTGAHKTEVSYITTGMEWRADYIAVAKENDSKLELNAWVTIENNCGTTFPEAKIKLMAGEIHRAKPKYLYRETKMMPEYALAEAAAPEFEEKSFFEYHLYTLNQPSTLKNNQIKQISLFPTVETRCKKIYVFEPAVSKKDVQVKLTFKNEKTAGMGMPLPAGKVRIYKEDPTDKSLELIGEDNIDHTPKDEEVKLYVGNAFDIKAERTQIDKKQTGKKSREETWEIKIRNHKDDNIEVQVIERFYYYWKIKKSSHPYKKLSANKVQFSVPVMKDSEAVLTYTVKLSW